MALVGLGSNLGNRLEMLCQGTRRLVARGDVVVEGVSPLYASQPVDAAGGEFLNAVIRIRTTLDATEFLRRAKAIERDLGRTGSGGDARPLDLDLLYYGDDAFTGPDLEVPHPRRLSRPFVVVPLAEVCGDLPEPGTGRTIADRIAGLAANGRGSVRRVQGADWFEEGLEGGRAGS